MNLQMSSDDITVSVSNVTKIYRIFGHPGDRIKQAVTFGLRKYHRNFPAIKDVSFTIKKGETVGIIGRNGSGKSTLLQLICGILKPTSGTVQVNGRVSALLELGAGFNPEFTGRENVYFQGALMGMGKEVMDARFDDIATFADIGEFIDQPVRTYSSGMFVRLAFAVAININPDILVVDEALAVGDSAFQAKCMIHLKTIQARNDVIILFVSHDMVAIQNLCTRVLTLNDGCLTHDASTGFSVERYRIEQTLPAAVIFPVDDYLRQGPRRFVSLRSIVVMNAIMQPATRFSMGERIVIDLSFDCHESIPEGRFGVMFSNDSGILLYDFASGFSGVIGFSIGRHTFRITTDPILAYPGRYHLGAWIQHSKGVSSDDYLRSALVIQIFDDKKVGHAEANFSGIRCSNTETFLSSSFEKI